MYMEIWFLEKALTAFRLICCFVQKLVIKWNYSKKKIYEIFATRILEVNISRISIDHIYRNATDRLILLFCLIQRLKILMGKSFKCMVIGNNFIFRKFENLDFLHF